MVIRSKMLIMLVIGNILTGCVQNPNSEQLYQTFKSKAIEPRDSLQILFTVKEWCRLNWFTFRDYSKMCNITNAKVEYFIGGVFYSPNKKRMIVFIGEKLPNASTIEAYSKTPSYNRVCPVGGDTIINVSALIGFRDRPNTLWNLYPLNNRAAGCCETKSECIDALKKYYFEQMKDHSEDVSKKFLDKNYGGSVRYDLEQKTIELGYGDTNSPMIGKDYGYNIQDKDFWNKSLLWQKGAIKEGYYDFQLLGYDPLNVPKVTYPKSILKLFTEASTK